MVERDLPVEHDIIWEVSRHQPTQSAAFPGTLVCTILVEAALGEPEVVRSRHELNEREQDVLRCFVRGLSYSQASDHLGIALDTVRNYVRGMYRKLQVHSVAEAVHRAVTEGLI